MKPIKQEDPFGCAVACVASVLGIGYQEALNIFRYGNKKAKTTGFYCKEIVKVLENKGLKYEYSYIKSKIKKKIYQDNTIVFLRRSHRYPEGHFLCRKGNFWMDSWVNFPTKVKKAGFRKRLPEKPIYVIYPVTSI